MRQMHKKTPFSQWDICSSLSHLESSSCNTCTNSRSPGSLGRKTSEYPQHSTSEERPQDRFSWCICDIHVIPGSPGEPIAKRIGSNGTVCHGPLFRSRRPIFCKQNSWLKNCQCTGRHDKTPSISVLCTCKDNELKENKLIESIADSTEIVVGRVQVRIPWWEDGPP